MKLLIATNNNGKIKEYQTMLSTFFPDLNLLTLRQAGIEHDVEETGSTFEENARLKATTYGKLSGLPVIADDSGLAIDIFNGFPGVHSNRWAGQNDTERNQLLLAKMTDVPWEKRFAKFVCTAIFRLPDGRELVAVGDILGRIGYEPRGENGFGYDPLFILPEWGVTMAQLSRAEKNAISHRGRAASELANQIKARGWLSE